MPLTETQIKLAVDIENLRQALRSQTQQATQQVLRAAGTLKKKIESNPEDYAVIFGDSAQNPENVDTTVDAELGGAETILEAAFASGLFVQSREEMEKAFFPPFP